MVSSHARAIGIEAQVQAYASSIRKCGQTRALAEGQRLHLSLSKFGLHGDTFLGNLLVQMYGSCGSLGPAFDAFDAIRYRNVRSWTILLGANVANGHLQDAGRVFHRMPQWDVFSSTIVMEGYTKSGEIRSAKQLFDSLPRRDCVCWNAMVTAYAQKGQLREAKLVLEKSPEQSLSSRNSMMDGFAKLGCVDEARQLFNSLPEASTYSWNIMVSAYAVSGQVQEAKEMFDEMRGRDVISYNIMLHAYAQWARINDARAVFESMAMVNKVSWNTILQSCSQLGRPDEARDLFLGMPDRDLLSWTCMVLAYGEAESASNTFVRMPRHDLVCWTAMLSVYTHNGHLKEARSMFDTMPGRDVFCWTNMVTAHAQQGQFEEAMRMFHKAPCHDSLSWVSLVLVNAQNGNVEEVKAMLERMPQYDDSLLPSLIYAYGQSGQLEQAKSTYDSMVDKTAVAANVLLSAYVHCKCHNEALGFFRTMDLGGLQADGTSFAVALNACASLQSLRDGILLHREASELRYDKLDMFVSTSLLSMYGECGELGVARSIFDSMLDRSVVSWSSMVGVYAENGRSKQALVLFKEMLQFGIRPSTVVFLNVLSACSHSGDSLEARGYFVSMRGDHGLVPVRDHYVCMVDALCRSGKLEEAEDLVRNMPFVPDDIAWMTLLSAYRSSSSSTSSPNKVQHAARKLVELDPDGKKGGTFTATFVMLWNLAAQEIRSGSSPSCELMDSIRKHVASGALVPT